MYKSIQACRAIAALLVVLYHLGQTIALDKYFGAKAFGVPFSFGSAGVEFFFVLSGFIIIWVHGRDIGNPTRLWGYLRKRAIRIYPTYWIVFAGVCALALLSPTLNQSVPRDFPTILKSLALLPQIVESTGEIRAPVLVVAWTLQYEILFYIFVAILILNRWIGIVATVAVLINYIVCQMGYCTFALAIFSNNWILLFCFGALVAYICKSSIKLRCPTSISVIATAALFAIALFEVLTHGDLQAIDRRLVYGFFSGILVLALVRSEGAGKLKIRSRLVSKLGDASYALYLIHYPMISALCKLAISLGLAGTFGAAILFPIILIMCILAALAFHTAVERPILNLLSRREPPQAPTMTKD